MKSAANRAPTVQEIHDFTPDDLAAQRRVNS